MKWTRREFMASLSAATLGLPLQAGDSLAAVNGIEFPTNIRHVMLVILGSHIRSVSSLPNPLDGVGAWSVATHERDGQTLQWAEHSQVSTFVEVLTGQVPLGRSNGSATFNECIRKKTGMPASDAVIIHSLDYHGGIDWHGMYVSQQPGFGATFGPLTLSMNRMFCRRARSDPRHAVLRNVDGGVDVTHREIRLLTEFVDALTQEEQYLPNVRLDYEVARYVHWHDYIALNVSSHLMRILRPAVITVNLMGFDDVFCDHGFLHYESAEQEYLSHQDTISTLIHDVRREVMNDPDLRETTLFAVVSPRSPSGLSVMSIDESRRCADVVSPGDDVRHRDAAQETSFNWNTCGPRIYSLVNSVFGVSHDV